MSGERYPIAAVRERVRLHPGPVLDFAVGRHRESPPDAVKELIIGRREGLLLTPCSAEEVEAFTAAAAGMLRRVYGVDVSPAAVLPVPGGRTAMSFLASSLIGPDDGVVVIEPAYPAFGRVASELRARVHTLPLDPERGFAPDLGRLGSSDASSATFVALNFPNNPTGAVISTAELAELLDLFEPATTVFNDATYGPLTFGPAPFSLLAEAGDRAGDLRLVELHSLAKLFALGPLSVAFLAGDEATISDLRDYSEFAWSDQSSLQVRVALRCLEDGDQYPKMQAVFRDRLARLHDTLVTLGFRPYPAASGMYLLCAAPAEIGGREAATSAEAANLLLSEHGVAVVPWEVPPHSYLRFSAQYTDDDLDALARIGGGGPIASG